jgi:hypothetical protein
MALVVVRHERLIRNEADLALDVPLLPAMHDTLGGRLADADHSHLGPAPPQRVSPLVAFAAGSSATYTLHSVSSASPARCVNRAATAAGTRFADGYPYLGCKHMRK